MGSRYPVCLMQVRARQHVLQIAAAHVEQIGLLEFFAVAARSAIVGRDHHVSLVDHVLDEAVERIHASATSGPPWTYTMAAFCPFRGML